MRVCYLFVFLFLCGCNLEPPYRKPPVCVPTGWKNGVCEGEKVCGPWWSVFHDPVLDRLEKRALRGNQNAYMALQKVAVARAQAGVSESDLYPHLSIDPAYQNYAQLYKLLFPVPLSVPLYFRIHQVWYELPLNVSWEIDLWGKLWNQYRTKQLQAMASEDDLCFVLLTLTTDLATAYFQVRTLDARSAVLRATVDVDRRQFLLVKERFEKGLVGALDLESAKMVLADAEAALFDTERQRKLQENKIAALLGLPASCFCLESSPLCGPPPCIPPGMPSQVLCRRPDVKEQQKLMEAQHAQIGVARAAFFPSLTLTGTLGYLSPDLKNFLTWNSRYWEYDAISHDSVFDAGKNSCNLEATWAAFFQTTGQYRQTVIQAFQEVEDALANLDMEKKQAQSLEAAEQAAVRARQITQHRYASGLVGYLDVITAEQNALNAQTDVVDIRGVQYLSTIQLIKAIGGSL